MSLPKTNISLLKVACLIGEITTNSNGISVLDTRLSKLCTSDKINIFSKYKPLAYVGDPNADPSWYKGADGKCGIIIPSLGSDFSIIDTANWTLNKPAGGSTSPYRLFYFGGYEHDAIPVVRTGITGDITANRGIDTTKAFHPYSIVSPSDYNISLDDIYLGNKLIGDCYFACQISYNGANVYACSSDIIRNHPSLTVDLSTFNSTLVNVKQTIRFFIVGEYFEQKTSWTIQDIQYCMWQNNSNLAVAGFTLKEDATFYISVQAVSDTLQSGTSGYTSISDHSTENTAKVIQANTGAIYLLCNMVNRSTGAWQIPLSSLRGKSQNWWEGSIERTMPEIYTTTGTRITSTITLPASSTVQYVFKWSYNYKNNILTTAPFSTLIRGNISFDYLNGSTYIDVNSNQNTSVAWYVKSSED